MSNTLNEQAEVITGFMDILLKHYPNAIYGPAHAILSDGNLSDIMITDTIIDCHMASEGQYIYGIDYIADGHSANELECTALILSMFLLYDEEAREIGWEEYYNNKT